MLFQSAITAVSLQKYIGIYRSLILLYAISFDVKEMLTAVKLHYDQHEKR